MIIRARSILQAYIPLAILMLLAFFLTRYSVTYGAGSDPRYTLIVSQSLIENGTIALDAYQDDLIWGASANFDANINILQRNGRYYNYFPVGPSLLAAPAIFITQAVGWDMRVAQDNINAQRLLSSLSVVLLLGIMYHIARLFLPPRDSLLITAVSLFGSTLISTLGVALWSLNFSVLFIAAALWLILRVHTKHSDNVHPILLGGLLFLAFFSRAASAAFILPVLLYLFYTDWRQGLKTAVSAATLLTLFLAWSQSQFGTWLPIYYSVARLQVQRTPLWLALAGQLISPSRGLFVFMPMFILLIPALFLYRKRFFRNPLLWLSLSWITLHLFIASRGAIWWGGDSFGPRILTELMLAFFLLTILIWQQIRTDSTRFQRKIWQTAYLVLGITAVFIHSYQGLYNNSTAVWNIVISEHPAPPLTSAYGDLFNWRIPQFLASNKMLCQIEEERARAALAQAPLLTSYTWGAPLTYANSKPIETAVTAQWLRGESDVLPTQQAFFLGWAVVNNDRAPNRATACDTIHILFTIEELPSDPIQLRLTTAAFGQQTAVLTLNQQPIGQQTFTQQPNLESETAVFTIPPQQFQPYALNDLTITLPNAQRANSNDPTRLSLAINNITLSILPP